MNVAKGLLDLLIGVLQGTVICGVCHEVLRSWSQSCQSFLFRKNVCVDFSATNPDDLGLIGADQIFTPDFTDPTCTSYDDIDSLSAVGFTFLDGGEIQRDEDLVIPVPMAAEPAMPLWIGWEPAHLGQGERDIGGQVDLLDLPVGHFFGQRPQQPEQTGMRGIPSLRDVVCACLTRDHRKAERLLPVAELEQGFEQTETGQDALRLCRQDTLLSECEQGIVRCQPEDFLNSAHLLQVLHQSADTGTRR